MPGFGIRDSGFGTRDSGVTARDSDWLLQAAKERGRHLAMATPSRLGAVRYPDPEPRAPSPAYITAVGGAGSSAAPAFRSGTAIRYHTNTAAATIESHGTRLASASLAKKSLHCQNWCDVLA